jgi:hypothetical protein
MTGEEELMNTEEGSVSMMVVTIAIGCCNYMI